LKLSQNFLLKRLNEVMTDFYSFIVVKILLKENSSEKLRNVNELIKKYLKFKFV